ncbi:hypothetical protein PG999_004503 [Apiospora kogelbergensis]|uniref:Uncharacterized protein n=1 Tax=Apiospora kogelbergensis TaxID=1337665 RepID=A0AAW0QZI7_9PEZI
MNNPTTTVSAQSQSDTTDLEEFGPRKLRRRTLPSLSRRRRTPYERNTTQRSSQISLAEISRQRIYYYCTRTATGQQESPPRHPSVPSLPSLLMRRQALARDTAVDDAVQLFREEPATAHSAYIVKFQLLSWISPNKASTVVVSALALVSLIPNSGL